MLLQWLTDSVTDYTQYMWDTLKDFASFENVSQSLCGQLSGLRFKMWVLTSTESLGVFESFPINSHLLQVINNTSNLGISGKIDHP